MDQQPQSDMAAHGMAVRREVLGSAYVDNAVEASSDFDRDFQRLVTEFCWGSVWTRPGLERKTRSLLNVGMLTAMNRPHELRIHTAGALRNGCTREEIEEVLMQVAVYCGIPAALDGLRVVRAVMDEELDD